MAMAGSILGGDAPAPESGKCPLAIDAVLVPKLSFASHQNAVPVLRDLKILNLGEAAIENILVEISADPPVFEPMQWRIDRIAAGGEAHITKRDLKLNAGLLLQLSEAVFATVTLQAHVEGETAGGGAQRAAPHTTAMRSTISGNCAAHS